MQKILINKKEINIFENYKEFFVKQKEFITIDELYNLIKIENISELNLNEKIYNVKTLATATKNDISFLSNTKYIEDLKKTNAGFCIVNENLRKYVPDNTKAIVVKNPHYAYTIILDNLYFVPLFEIESGISERAFIHESAKIGKNVEIQPGVYIDKNVIISDNCKICANAVINHDCFIGEYSYIGANSTISYAKIGKNTIIHNGANIGQCGFGFAYNDGFNYKIPQLGIVRIGNFCEIGACSCIDRGAFDDTVIGDMTKIDNQVQIGHGTTIGKGCFFAGQSGVAGSTNVGNFVQFGGKAGSAGHIKINDFSQIAGNSITIQDVPTGSIVSGYPAMPIRDWERSVILLKKMIKNTNKK